MRLAQVTGRPFGEFVLLNVQSKESAGAALYLKSVREASQVEKICRKLAFRGWRFSQKKLKQSDWFDKWKEDYQIRPFGKKFIVVPQWRRQELKAGWRIPIYINPGGAFGSGEHETTRLTVRLLERAGAPFKNFFDVGTGTGILAVAAAKLGAGNIWVLDLDSASVDAAEANLRLNRGPKPKTWRRSLETLRTGRKFEFVAANLVSDVLIENRRKLAALTRPGGRLAVSGILKSNLPGFLKAFKSPHLKKLCVLKGRCWSAVLYQRLKN